MNITYNENRKNLPINQLYNLFLSAGWATGELEEEHKAGFMRCWLNSTLVISAWDGEQLIGVVRVLSDTIFRSVIYDLLVVPEYQYKGIGSELVRRCIAYYPKSEWLLHTEKAEEFYTKLGFKRFDSAGCFMIIPSKLF